VSIKNLFANTPVSREAEAWFDDECIYIPSEAIVEAVGLGLKRAEIGKILDRHGLLSRTDGDRKTYRRMPGLPNVTVFALDRAKMGPAPLEVVGVY